MTTAHSAGYGTLFAARLESQRSVYMTLAYSSTSAILGQAFPFERVTTFYQFLVRRGTLEPVKARNGVSAMIDDEKLRNTNGKEKGLKETETASTRTGSTV